MLWPRLLNWQSKGIQQHGCQWRSNGHPLNTHWGCMNAIEWVRALIECAWMLLSECEHILSAHECHWVNTECNSPWYDHEKDLIHVRTEHALNACECTWMPLSEHWTPPECLWVCVNASEWVLNTPWTPIECAWMPLIKYLDGLNVHL